MKVLTFSLLVLAAVALSACYVSNGLLLDADAAARPLEDGVYARDGGGDRYRVQRELDGWYDVEEFNPNGTLGETHRVLFNELPLGRLTGFAVAEETNDGFTYAVALKEDDRVYLAIPDCADPLDASVASDNGGEPQDDDSPDHDCRFKDRDDLTAALAAFAGQADFGAPYRLQTQPAGAP